MKKLSMILLALVFIMTGCNDKDSIWNVMGDMDSRISRLEALCQEMNTNISALETLIKAQDKGDYITNITEIRNGSTIVGYTITFKVHAPITVYNGTNGKDGTNGYTPLLGAKQDTDGVYYWTVDGNWLTDTDGNKLRVSGEKGDKGDKGDQGDKGQDGTNGVNGNTPQLKIDGGYWYLSYDGTNWSKLGKATGENGTNGSDGAKGDKGDKGDAGDTMFRSVTQDDDYVYFTLADGTLIKIAKSGSSSGGTHADSDIIEFRDLNVKAALLQYTPAIDTNGDGEISYAEAKAVKELKLPYTITLGSSNLSVGADIVSFKEFQYFTGIKDFKFRNLTKLVEITLPEDIKGIPTYAFESTAMSSLTIPQGCDSIGKGAFNKCTSLRSLVLPPSIKYIGDDAINNILVTFQDIDNSSLEYIGKTNFSIKTDGRLPNSIKYIKGSITGTGKIIYLPQKLIGDPITYAFDTIVWNSTNWEEGYSRESYDYASGIGSYWYHYNSYHSSYEYSYDKTISAIIFGVNVSKIPSSLCAGLAKLTKVTIPDNVIEIGSAAFYNCTSLTEVTIGKNVQTIGENAFNSIGFNTSSIYNGRLKKVYCEAQQPPIIGRNAIPTTISVIYVPRQSVDEYRVVWSDYASKILGYDFE